MPEDKEKQKKLDRLLSLLDPDNALSRKDFEDSFKKVIELVMKLIQRHEEAIKQLFADHARITGEFKQDYTSNLSELRKQVDRLFVEEKLKQMDSDTKASFGKLQRFINEAVENKLREADERVSQLQPIKGDKGDRGDIGPMPTEHLELMKEVQAELKKVKEVLANRPQGKAMGRVKVPIVRRVDLTSQIDGATRSFTLERDTVAILGIFGSQFPFTMSDADIIFRGNILTLGDQVATPASGQTLFALVESLFYP